MKYTAYFELVFEAAVFFMDINLIKFNTDIGKIKPENIIHTDNDCPFCDVEHLTNIIDTDDDIIFLKNKYNVIEGADQFVLIETHECDSDMPNYSTEHMRRVIKMGLKHWNNLLNCGKYEEVLFFKNYGAMSGGTIKHPHMQIVGFPKLKSKLLFFPEEMHGVVIKEFNGVEMNVSNCPRIGFGEINIVPQIGSSIDTFADFIKIGVDYLMHYFRKNLTSYNIFFYHEDKQIYVKIMPRFATSPYFVGYNVRFLPNNVKRIADEIRTIYFD